MEKQFAPYAISQQIRDLGFNEPCFTYYDDCGDLCLTHMSSKTHQNSDEGLPVPYCSAPLWQQVIDWFREKHNIHIYIYLNAGKDAYNVSLDYTHFVKDEDDIEVMNQGYEYEEAREKSILKAIELIKK